MSKKRCSAGLSINGGRRDQFFFTLFDYYEDSQRWFLKSILKLKDETDLDGDEAIKTWIDRYSLEKLFVEVPLGTPACSSCQLKCPGQWHCSVDSVVKVRAEIEAILERDHKAYQKNPKQYERDRNRDDLYDHSKDVLANETNSPILSRSFKRRLKKGYLPYWNRTIDFWVWCHYHDQLLEIFNYSFDSFGNSSLMLMSRFSYLRHHFPSTLHLFETNVKIVLIELLRAGIISRRDLDVLSHIEEGVLARLNIVKSVEKKLGVFVYESDLELIIKHPHAFESFILGLCGVYRHRRALPDWVGEDDSFFVPEFACGAVRER